MTMPQLCSMIPPEIHKSEAWSKPLTLVYPENPIVNPEKGKPVSMGTHHPGCEISEAVALALSQAIPERAVPQVYKAAMPTVLLGFNPKTNGLFIDHSVDTTSTTSSAAYGQDGWGCTNAGFGNLVMATAEVNESIFPHRQLSHDLTIDTGGPGQWRGQCGSFYIKEVTLPQMVYTFVLGMKYPAVGIAGGHNGSPNHLGIRRMNGELEEIKHTALYLPLNPGERIEYHFAGGGGRGDPLERAPQKARDNVRDQYASRGPAELRYCS